MTIFKSRLVIFSIILSLYISIFNFFLLKASDDPQKELALQRHFLSSSLRNGSGSRMQIIFPEGYFFTHVLYGLSKVDEGRQYPLGSEQREESISEVRLTLKNLESSEAKAPFRSINNPPFGIFYSGWRAWLTGGLLLLQSDGHREIEEVEQFKNYCEQIAKAFSLNKSTPFLPAYPGLAWPVDSSVAIAALKLHDKLFPAKYTELISNWITSAKKLIDPNTGLIPHRVSARNASMITGARGSSQSLLLRFLIEIEPEWAKQQYTIFRKLFFHLPFGVPGIREYPVGIFGVGDIDSGPLIFGTSASASAVTMGTALSFNDNHLASILSQTAEAAGMPITSGVGKRYLFGIVPVGDAFLTWAKGAKPWICEIEALKFPLLVEQEWKTTILCNSILISIFFLCFSLLKKIAEERGKSTH